MTEILRRIAEVIESRKLENGGNPEKSYVSSLFAKGDDAILKKVGEEATEAVMAAKDIRNNMPVEKLTYEVADLWFHSMIMLSRFGLSSEDVLNELARREGLSGLVEKANRKKQTMNNP